MAAGNAARFGENKLAAMVNGKPLIEHALEAIPRESFFPRAGRDAARKRGSGRQKIWL